MAKNIFIKALRKPWKAVRELSYLGERAFGAREYQPFLILTRSRTGSTLLSSSLDSHPEICCRGEKLNFLRGRDPQKIINGVYGKHPKRIKAAGFKIFYYHPNDADGTNTWSILEQIPDLKVIHLRRKNILRTLVSRKIADVTGQYDSRKKVKSIAKQVHFTYDELLESIESTVQMESDGVQRFSGCEILELTYEELIQSDDAKSRAQEFVGVSPKVLSSPLRKQNPEPLSGLIANFAELQSQFAGSPWQSLFVD